MCTLFYFTFYRMLFEDFVDWTTFTVLQALHLVMEWCLYCVRGTKLFYSFFKGLPDWTGSLKNVVIMRGLSHRDWQIFLTLDFALRAEIMLFSAPVSTAHTFSLVLPHYTILLLNAGFHNPTACHWRVLLGSQFPEADLY